MTFEQGLRNHLAAKRRLTLRDRRVLRVLDAKPSRHRTEFLANAEVRARDRLGFRGADWSAVKAVDWDKVLEIIKLLIEAFLKIAPLFLKTN